MRALKWAAWIKIGLTAFGWLVFAVAGMLNSDPLAGMALFGMVDMLLGVAALAAVSFVAGMKGPEAVAGADSFGWTTLTTMTEGALVALLIAGIAVCVWVAWRIWPGLKARFFSPARLAG